MVSILLLIPIRYDTIYYSPTADTRHGGQCCAMRATGARTGWPHADAGARAGSHGHGAAAHARSERHQRAAVHQIAVQPRHLYMSTRFHPRARMLRRQQQHRSPRVWPHPTRESILTLFSNQGRLPRLHRQRLRQPKRHVAQVVR